MIIYKYKIGLGSQVIAMPQGAALLSVQMQRDEPCLWALCDEAEPVVDRTITTFGTGNDIPDGSCAYVGTFQMAGGALVWHVFDGGEE